jgi:hypothetical protein
MARGGAGCTVGGQGRTSLTGGGTVGWPLPITHELKLRDDTPSTAREAVTLG